MRVESTTDEPIAVVKGVDGTFLLLSSVTGRSRHASVADVWSAIDEIDAPGSSEIAAPEAALDPASV